MCTGKLASFWQSGFILLMPLCIHFFLESLGGVDVKKGVKSLMAVCHIFSGKNF